MKSLRFNTVANFFGLAYSSTIAIFILPLYLRHLGAEAFGLVGFFTMLQSWMQLLDVGMSPMLSRQMALARSRTIKFIDLKKLLRSIELFFLLLSLTVFIGIWAGSLWIARSWLTITLLNIKHVAFCIVLMGGMVGLNLFSSLYRSGMRGLEEQVRLNVFNVAFISSRYIGALLLLKFVTQDFVYFFVYQLAVSIAEAAALGTVLYRLIPATEQITVNFFWNIVKPVLPFAGGIAYTAGIWVLMTQTDKLILSKVLPLSEYGYFALVVTISTGISQISTPISQAILPRMTSLLSQGNREDMLKLYRAATHYMAVLIFPVAGMITLFSHELLFTWTGDKVAVEWAAPILVWFVLGNTILTIGAFQYYLQFAYGNLKIHVIYTSIFASIQVPVMIYTALEYGAMGVAVAWCTLRAISFILLPFIVHRKFAPGVHWLWLSHDIFPIFLTTVTALFFLDFIDIDFSNVGRGETFAILLGLGILVLSASIISSTVARKFLYHFFTFRIKVS